MKTGTITGRFTDPTGTPATGTVTFTPEAAGVLLPADNQIILPAPVKVTLDALGAFSQTLAATDDPTANPVDWTWKVKVDAVVAGRQTVRAPFSIHVLSDLTADLADIAPVPSTDGVQIVKGDRGETGERGLRGYKGEKGLTGDTGPRGSRWYASTPQTPDFLNVTGMVEGDVFFYPGSRDLFVYQDGAWIYSGAIATIKGDKGDKGEPGVYVGDAQPQMTQPGIWIQTGLGASGTGFSLWIEDGK